MEQCKGTKHRGFMWKSGKPKGILNIANSEQKLPLFEKAWGEEEREKEQKKKRKKDIPKHSPACRPAGTKQNVSPVGVQKPIHLQPPIPPIYRPYTSRIPPVYLP